MFRNTALNERCFISHHQGSVFSPPCRLPSPSLHMSFFNTVLFTNIQYYMALSKLWRKNYNSLPFTLKLYFGHTYIRKLLIFIRKRSAFCIPEKIRTVYSLCKMAPFFLRHGTGIIMCTRSNDFAPQQQALIHQGPNLVLNQALTNTPFVLS